jgi:hypothetical protein
MPRSPTDRPKYLMCARALALLSGLAAGAVGCGQSLVPESGPKDATTPAYDGGSIGIGAFPDAHPTPYDGGVVGSRPIPYDGAVIGVGPAPHPYDGGSIGVQAPYDGGVTGVRVNPDANVRPDAQTSPYDGGFFGVRINPDAL